MSSLSGWAVSVTPGLSPGAFARPSSPVLPFPLEEGACRLFARSAQALWAGTRWLGIRPGESLLVPAFLRPSALEALNGAGIACRFFDWHDGGEPDEAHVERLLDPGVRGLLIAHRLGLPEIDVAHWRRWCDARRLLLIEDATDAWLALRDGQPLGSYGDLGVLGLDRMLGLPDGAALISQVPPPAPAADGLGVLGLWGRHRAWLMQRMAPLVPSPAGVADERGSARSEALGDPSTAPGQATLALVPRLAEPWVAARRRAHYRFLIEQLGDRVHPSFRDLAPDASPLVFPIQAADDTMLAARVRARGVQVLSPVPAQSGRFPGAARARAGLVGLPVHQELREKDLARIVHAVRGTAPARALLTLEPAADMGELRSLWTRLAERSRNLFNTWEWADAWWRHLGHGRLRLVVARRPGGEPVAVLALYETARGPVSIMRLIGHGPADQLGPVCDPADTADVARALRDALGTLLRCDAFVGDDLAADDGWSIRLGARTIAREASPVLDIGGMDWSDYLASRTSHFRKRIRYQERRLFRDHRATYRLCDDPARLEEDLDTLVELHEARWRPGASVAFAGDRGAFHRDFAARALERGWLRLWFLEADGRAVAAWYGFRFGGSEWFKQGGRDPAWDDRSVAAVLVTHTIREAVRDGVQEYRFLRGNEPYKRRYCDADRSVETIVAARGAAARLTISGAAVAAAMPARVRQRVLGTARPPAQRTR